MWHTKISFTSSASLPILHLISILTQIALCQQPLETVVKYNYKEFTEKVPTNHHFVLFFAPWSGDSKSVAPVWEELGQKYNNNIDYNLVIAKVDCTQEVQLCAEQNITDFPTIKYYKIGGEDEGVRHRGVRDFHSLEQFINGFVNIGTEFVYGARVERPPPVSYGLHTLQDENFDEVVQNGNAFINFCAPWSTRCMELESVWAELAKHFQYDDDVTFGQVDCTMHKSTCNEHEVRGYPSLLWFTEGISVEKYPTRERDFETLKAYVYKRLGKKEAPKKSPNQAAEDSKIISIQLDKDNFQTTIDNEKLIFVNFQTPWCTPCQKLDPIWEELAGYYRNRPNTIKIAKVDCTRSKQLCEQENIEEFPTMNLYHEGILQGPYGGPMKTEDLIDFCQSAQNIKKDEL